MKSTGIARELDSLGRIVIPKEIRDTYAWQKKTPLEIFTHGAMLVIVGPGGHSEVPALPADHPLMQEALDCIRRLPDTKLLLCLDLLKAFEN